MTYTLKLTYQSKNTEPIYIYYHPAWEKFRDDCIVRGIGPRHILKKEYNTRISKNDIIFPDERTAMLWILKYS